MSSSSKTTSQPPASLPPPPPQPLTSPPPPPPPQAYATDGAPIPPGIVVVGMPMPMMPLLMLGKESQQMRCPMCHNQIITVPHCRPSQGAWIYVLILVCFFWPLMWIPCVMCQDVEHMCPVCGAPVGYYRDPTCR